MKGEGREGERGRKEAGRSTNQVWHTPAVPVTKRQK